MGKDDSVIDLLRHIPYLRRVHPSSVSLLPIYPGVIPIDYPEDGWDPERTHFYPLPSHCVYLAQRDDSQGTDLILDASSGAVTEFSSNNRITVPYEEYEMLPEGERWRAHPTTPLPELLDRWAQMYRRLNLLVSPNPIERPCAVNFRFHERTISCPWLFSCFKVYQVYIRCRWPDNFKEDDKEQLNAELLRLEEEDWAETKRIMDQHNPDAALFDSD